MSKEIEFHVEYSPEHELATEKAILKPAAFEITSESIRTLQNVCIFRFDLVYLNNHYQDIYFHIDFVVFLVYDNNH